MDEERGTERERVQRVREFGGKSLDNRNKKFFLADRFCPSAHACSAACMFYAGIVFTFWPELLPNTLM